MKVRIGQVEGPFTPSKYYYDGSKKSSNIIRKQGKAKYWVVRYLEGTILKSAKFGSSNVAKTFFDELEPYVALPKSG